MNDKPPSASDLRTAREKVRTIDQLGEIARSSQADGHKVVLAHGVFDLVHMGHIRHLEAAKREGDILVVTLTADKFVNKGPSRPIFTEDMRAEMVAAIGYVDFVGVNHASSAEGVLNAIRPDVYIKGSDYENPEDDITGKIAEERDAVEKHGGRLVLTKDITFSSSSLINKYLDVYDRPLRDYLEHLRESGTAERISLLVESISNYRILFVGDAIIDEYQYVAAMGKAAKEHIIATKFLEKEVFAGGVFAAANHVANFCKEVEIITCIGDDPKEREFITSQLKDNVKVHFVVRAGAPTTRKCRFVEHNYLRKLFEVYTIDDTPLEETPEGEVNALIEELAGKFDVVIATDFGHGLISPHSIDIMSDKAKFLAVNTQTNSANIGYNLISRYKRADYVCIDAPEAYLAARDRFTSLERVISEKLPPLVDSEKFIVTHGREGCVTYQAGGQPVRIPAFTKTVVDTVGAGDAFLSITSPLAAAGGDLETVGFVGNAVGAMKVGIVGHRSSVEKVPLMRYITTLLK